MGLAGPVVGPLGFNNPLVPPHPTPVAPVHQEDPVLGSRSLAPPGRGSRPYRTNNPHDARQGETALAEWVYDLGQPRVLPFVIIRVDDGGRIIELLDIADWWISEHGPTARDDLVLFLSNHGFRFADARTP